MDPETTPPPAPIPMPPPPPTAATSVPPSDILPEREGAWKAMSLEEKVSALDDAVRMLEQTVRVVRATVRALNSIANIHGENMDEFNGRTVDLAGALLTVAQACEKGSPDHARHDLRGQVLAFLCAPLDGSGPTRAATADLLMKTSMEAADKPADPPKGDAELSPAASPNNPSPSVQSTASTPSAPAAVLADNAFTTPAFDERQLGGVLGADGQVHSDADPGL